MAHLQAGAHAIASKAIARLASYARRSSTGRNWWSCWSSQVKSAGGIGKSETDGSSEVESMPMS